MSEVFLLVTSGGGPEECRVAVGHVVTRIRKEAEVLGLDTSTSNEAAAPASTILMIAGDGAQEVAGSWTGTILWRQKSASRPNHRRTAWFIGVFEMPGNIDIDNEIPAVPEVEVTFSTFRAGGPGGQHQNTTDSAVRATWNGYVAVSRDERSQHRNKAKALKRLNHLVRSARRESIAETSKVTHSMHRTLERGTPKRTFTGPGFKEV